MKQKGHKRWKGCSRLPHVVRIEMLVSDRREALLQTVSVCDLTMRAKLAELEEASDEALKVMKQEIMMTRVPITPVQSGSASAICIHILPCHVPYTTGTCICLDLGSMPLLLLLHVSTCAWNREVVLLWYRQSCQRLRRAC